MKGTLNKITLIGRLGQNPELKTTEKGANIARFSLATSDGTKDNVVTDWHNIVVFGNSADFVNQYYQKGDLVYVEGKLKVRNYKDKNGNDKVSVQIISSSTQKLSSTSTTNENIPSVDDLESFGAAY